MQRDISVIDKVSLPVAPFNLHELTHILAYR